MRHIALLIVAIAYIFCSGCRVVFEQVEGGKWAATAGWTRQAHVYAEGYANGQLDACVLPDSIQAGRYNSQFEILKY